MCTIPNFVSYFQVRTMVNIYSSQSLIKKYLLSLLLESSIYSGFQKEIWGQNKNFNAILKRFLCLVGVCSGPWPSSWVGQGSSCGGSSSSRIGDSIRPRNPQGRLLAATGAAAKLAKSWQASDVGIPDEHLESRCLRPIGSPNPSPLICFRALLASIVGATNDVEAAGWLQPAVTVFIAAYTTLLVVWGIVDPNVVGT